MHSSAFSIPASPVAGCSCTIPANPTTPSLCALFIDLKLMRICLVWQMLLLQPRRLEEQQKAGLVQNSWTIRLLGLAAEAEVEGIAAVAGRVGRRPGGEGRATVCWPAWGAPLGCSLCSGSSLCSAVIAAYIAAQFSSVTAGTAFSRLP